MKIFLVCSGGMSTSLLVESMKKEIASRNLQHEVEAIPLSSLERRINEASAILVAPQMRHRLKSVEELGTKVQTPVAVIDSASYGRIDGKGVLEQALCIMKDVLKKDEKHAH